MALRTRCPNCGQEYQVASETLGGRARCKACDHVFTVELKVDDTSVPPSARPGASPPSQVSQSGRPSPPPSQVSQSRRASPPPSQVSQSGRPSPPPSMASPPSRADGPVGAAAAAGSSRPARIGQYKIVDNKPLGEGGMGAVYLGLDETLDRKVAIKLLPEAFARDDHRLQRFLREARSAAQIHDTHVAAIYQAGVDRGRTFIAMEYIDGESLDEAVRSGGPMPWRDATRLIRDAALGLAAAHRKGLIHRDIKPANLMRSSEGVTKVVDFGLARAREAQTQLTSDGSVLGTPAYMSPEQWSGGDVDGRSDLYSLICSYYCLLTGRPPYGDAVINALGYLHRSEPLPDPRKFASDLPDGVCRVILRGAAKDPSERYQSAEELVEALDALLASPEESLMFQCPWPAPTAPTAVAPMATPLPQVDTGRGRTTGSERFRRWASQQRRPPTQVLVAAGAAALILLLGLVMYVRTDHGTVRIELSDTAADMEVKVDGDRIDIEGLNEPLRLEAGEHGLEVTSGEFQTVTKQFTVRDGEEEVVKVALVRASGAEQSSVAEQPAATTSQSPQSTQQEEQATDQPWPKIPGVAGKQQPPPAIAPFDDQQAKAHQQAWADYLGVPVEMTNSIGMKFMLIPPGEFLMGSPESDKDAQDNEKPQHRVRITRPFYLGATEVTQGQYEAVTGSRPWTASKHIVEGEKYPAGVINWEKAVEFCRQLNQDTGKSYRLPTEAEWEYACRAGNPGKHSLPDAQATLTDYAWIGRNAAFAGEYYPHIVGQKLPNPWGLYDMHGNQCEPCVDWYAERYYGDSPVNDPTGPSVGSRRILRGGSFDDHRGEVRSAMRDSSPPKAALTANGFRVVLIPQQFMSREDGKAKPDTVGIAPAEADATHPATAPPLAIAPFDEQQAKAHQQAWADYLGVPVEMTNSIGMKFMLIPPGEFMMGTESGRDWNRPIHRVRISRPFYLGATEVTQKQWEQVMNSQPWTGEYTPWCKGADLQHGPDFPAFYLSWEDSAAFCQRLSETQRDKYRLPTEAEWEYACRAGTTTDWSFGNDQASLGQYAWYRSNTREAGEYYAHRIGQKLPNPWGLFDVYGNLLEWCQDWFGEEYYAVSPQQDPTGPTSGEGRVIRGGSFCRSMREMPTGLRHGHVPNIRAFCDHVGFRVVRDISRGTEGDDASNLGRSSTSGASKERVGSPPRPAVNSTGPLKGAPATIREVAAWQPARQAHALMWHPDGKLLAIGTERGTAQILNVATQEVEHTFQVGDDRVYALAFSPDGRRLATSSHESPLKLWDVETRKELWSTREPHGRMQNAVFSPDGKLLAVCGWDFPPTLVDPADGRVIRTVEQHVDGGWCQAFSPDGKVLASAAHDKHVRLWDVATGSQIHAFPRDIRLGSVTFTPDGKTVVGAGDNWHSLPGTLTAWDVATKRELFSLKAPAKRGAEFGIKWLDFNADGSILAMSLIDGQVTLWDFANRSELATFEVPKNRTYVDFTPDGRLLAAAAERWIKIWEVVPPGGKKKVSSSSPNAGSSDGAKRQSGEETASTKPREPMEWPDDAPPLAIAPFDEEQAKAHQKAWADYLGVPVEMTNSVGMKFMLIPPGEFMMGSAESDKDAQDNEKPQHRVRLTRPFYLTLSEVTQKQYESLAGKAASFGRPDDSPAGGVSWNDTVKFCQMLSEKEDRAFRLPTEAEWEYACRAGTTTRWCFGDAQTKLDEYAWHKGNLEHGSIPAHVGAKKPNAWGLYGMHGDPREWCADLYGQKYYGESADVDPQGPDVGKTRVVRGGGFIRSNASELRSAFRSQLMPETAQNSPGFRVAMTVPAK